VHDLLLAPPVVPAQETAQASGQGGKKAHGVVSAEKSGGLRPLPTMNATPKKGGGAMRAVGPGKKNACPAQAQPHVAPPSAHHHRLHARGQRHDPKIEPARDPLPNWHRLGTNWHTVFRFH
jgi:hypothetical protein